MMIVKIPKNLYQTQDFSICNTGLSFGPFKPKTLKHVAHKFAELFYFHQTALLTPNFSPSGASRTFPATVELKAETGEMDGLKIKICSETSPTSDDCLTLSVDPSEYH